MFHIRCSVFQLLSLLKNKQEIIRNSTNSSIFKLSKFLRVSVAIRNNEQKKTTHLSRIFSEPGPQSATSLWPEKFFATLLHQASVLSHDWIVEDGLENVIEMPARRFVIRCQSQKLSWLEGDFLKYEWRSFATLLHLGRDRAPCYS